MKMKSIKIGDWIEAKSQNDLLEKESSYKVLSIEETTVMIEVPKSPEGFLWVHPIDFRKPKPKVELTGDDLCRAMLVRGDKVVLCIVRDDDWSGDEYYDAITHYNSKNHFESSLSHWNHVIPINSMGEILTASDVGLLI